jgi:hypothetical protein
MRGVVKRLEHVAQALQRPLQNDALKNVMRGVEDKAAG